jgi:hypothetical protein
MTDSTLAQKALLEKFVVDNHDLETLTSLLNQFNIFEAVGMVRQEIRHSNFLAFLLNPTASHHLGDLFLKTFLKRLLIGTDKATVSAIEVDVANLTDTEVRREWKNIDLLLVSPNSRIVCAIENKVDSGEHSKQLQRYRHIVQQEFSNYHQIFVFLTPQGIMPQGEADQQHWLVYSYRKIAEVINDVCDRYRSTLQPEVCTLMLHYSTLINRHLMQDSEIAKLCRQIYAQHKEALDLIYEHRPDPEAEVFDVLKTVVKDTPANTVVLNHAWFGRRTIGFAIPAWDALPFQKTCQGWTPTRRILLFEFKLDQQSIWLELNLGPGQLSDRMAVFEALNNQDIIGFTGSKPQEESGWVTLVTRTISGNVSPEASISEIAEEVRSFWQQFLKDELPRINEAIVRAFGTDG